MLICYVVLAIHVLKNAILLSSIAAHNQQYKTYSGWHKPSLHPTLVQTFKDVMHSFPCEPQKLWKCFLLSFPACFQVLILVYLHFISLALLYFPCCAGTLSKQTCESILGHDPAVKTSSVEQVSGLCVISRGQGGTVNKPWSNWNN